MEKVITRPKIKLPLERTPKEIWAIWERARGIWKRKKIDPIKYLRKTRREWEKAL